MTYQGLAAGAHTFRVAATDGAGRSVSFTQHGPWIDITAVGTGVLSTSSTGNYVFGDGTSFSAPLVSAAANAAKSLL